MSIVYKDLNFFVQHFPKFVCLSFARLANISVSNYFVLLEVEINTSEMPQNDRINNTERLQSEVYLDGFLAEFRQALRDEIKEIEKNGLSSIQLKEGHRLYSSSGFWYQFKIDYLPNIPADTPCKLTIGSEDHDVTVIAFDDSSLTIEAKEELPNTIAEAKLENGTTVLLELLIKRIEKNSTKANPAGQRMMQASNEEIQVVDSNGNISFGDNLDVAQINAITSAVCNNMTFIGDLLEQGKPP